MTVGQAKHLAHRWFDPLWADGYMTRGEAYQWLSEQTGIHPNECHISMFDVGLCEAVVWLCRNKLNHLQAVARHYVERR